MSCGIYERLHPKSRSGSLPLTLTDDASWMNPGRSHRNAWSFWAMQGVALGASLWMPVTAIVSGWPTVGLVASVISAGAILMTPWILWRLRDRMEAYSGLMILLAVAFAGALTFFITAIVLKVSIVDQWPVGRPHDPVSLLWVLVIYPIIALSLRLKKAGHR